jgi:uncharacterized membrane protein
MIKAEYRFSLPISPREAFATLSDPARDPDWQSVCEGTKLLNGAARPGCRYEIIFLLIGRRMEFTAEILEYEPGVRSKFRSLEGPFSYIGTYIYSHRSDGTTDVHWTFEVEDPGNYFGIVPEPLVQKLLTAQVKKDTGKLAARLRADSQQQAS